MKSELPDYCSFKEDSLIGCNTPDFRSCHSVSQTSKIKHLIIIAVPVTCNILIFTILAILLFARRTKSKKLEKRTAKNGDLFFIWNYDGKIAFEDIIEATQDFDIRYCIGTGGYGSVYRAQLPSGKVVALKKLHQLESQNPSFEKSFRNEVKMLTQIIHRNIVKLQGFCLHNRTLAQLDFLILILQTKPCKLEHMDILHQFWSGGIGNINGKTPRRSNLVFVRIF
ncbi:hypothetical protein HN873_040565 [Arachis hypogaea]